MLVGGLVVVRSSIKTRYIFFKRKVTQTFSDYKFKFPKKLEQRQKKPETSTEIGAPVENGRAEEKLKDARGPISYSLIPPQKFEQENVEKKEIYKRQQKSDAVQGAIQGAIQTSADNQNQEQLADTNKQALIAQKSKIRQTLFPHARFLDGKASHVDDMMLLLDFREGKPLIKDLGKAELTHLGVFSGTTEAIDATNEESKY